MGRGGVGRVRATRARAAIHKRGEREQEEEGEGLRGSVFLLG